MTAGVVMQESEIRAAAAEARAWMAPLIDGEAVPGPSRQQREEERRAYAEAEAAGRAAGLAAAQKEMAPKLATLEQQVRAFTTALEALSRPLAQVDDVVHEQIARLALLIARAVVRRELRTDPTQVIGMVRETVALLPASARGVRITLHPEDVALLRARLAPAGPEAAWTLVEDPALGRGDCRVHTDYASLDARIETRLGEALAALVGEERAQPRDGGEA